MLPKIKKLFDWTPRDIEYWEKIQRKGLRNFVGMYGIVVTGGFMFLIFGLFSLFGWLKGLGGKLITPTSLIFLFGQLIFVAMVCILAGIIISLVTWVVEQKIYHRYYKTQSRVNE